MSISVDTGSRASQIAFMNSYVIVQLQFTSKEWESVGNL